ncbi:hypothetical protein [Desulfovibrio litoralis]|uniref:RiboL-PSP-HEPN domain-containing protein n=1 Tax=Desulfovibrio litoralis DSM 11393 TaxID=1121455 RepID=A0A1M7S7A9_9BACT|nr:hypothetical protein [Desulfovibrio litoralis]SHN54232.1 hypothetical protein SAMN02745728_00510 [Desulfovibrio litoralis DSM 11393]
MGVDRNLLPEYYPTHQQSSEFWEHLGRAVATFGFLEEVLKRAIFNLTGSKRVNKLNHDGIKRNEDEINIELVNWANKIEKDLTSQLYSLAEIFGKAHRNIPNKEGYNYSDELVQEIKKASEIRNVLCHGSWRPSDSLDKSLPLYFKKKKGLEAFDTNIDIEWLKQAQKYTTELACKVMDSVTLRGIDFPGTQQASDND